MNFPLDVLKIAALALGGAVAALALRRAPARVRHDVWLLVIVGAVVVPLAEATLPPLYFSVSASWEPLADLSSRWLWLAVAVWGAGTLVALLRLIPGVVELRRVAAGAVPLGTPAARAALAEAVRRTGCRRPVALLQSPDIRVPATWGVRRPIVVLPLEAAEWPGDRLRLVLLHELLHVRRQDAAVELFLWIAGAVYWFHPAVWLAVRRVRLERERACDEAVLRSGARASDYCEHLVEIMRAAARRPAGAVIGAAMATPSTLEYRVRAILDRGLPARHVWLGAPILLVGAVAMYMLAALAPCTALAELHPSAHPVVQHV